jgi:hypothetical protein
MSSILARAQARHLLAEKVANHGAEVIAVEPSGAAIDAAKATREHPRRGHPFIRAAPSGSTSSSAAPSIS